MYLNFKEYMIFVRIKNDFFNNIKITSVFRNIHSYYNEYENTKEKKLINRCISHVIENTSLFLETFRVSENRSGPR